MCCLTQKRSGQIKAANRYTIRPTPMRPTRMDSMRSSLQPVAEANVAGAQGEERDQHTDEDEIEHHRTPWLFVMGTPWIRTPRAGN